MIIVGSITGNTNTLAGNVPPKADLGDLSGLASGASMIDGKEFDGAKAYKDSKVGIIDIIVNYTTDIDGYTPVFAYLLLSCPNPMPPVV
jgi:hypothetical protein